MYNVHTPHRRMHMCLYACTYKPTHSIHTRLMAVHYVVSAYGKQYSSLSHTHSLCAQRKNSSCMWMWSFAWHCTAMPLYRASADQHRSLPLTAHTTGNTDGWPERAQGAHGERLGVSTHSQLHWQCHAAVPASLPHPPPHRTHSTSQHCGVRGHMHAPGEEPGTEATVVPSPEPLNSPSKPEDHGWLLL